MTLYLLIAINFGTAHARTNLFRAPVPTATPQTQVETKAPLRRKPASSTVSKMGMFPRIWTQAQAGNPIVSPSDPPMRKLGDLKLGTIASALIEQSVIAFSTSKAPVAAKVTTDSQREYLLFARLHLSRIQRGSSSHSRRFEQFNQMKRSTSERTHLI